MVILSRTAPTSALALCLSLLSAQSALSGPAPCDASAKAKHPATAQPCADTTLFRAAADALAPPERASLLTARAISLLWDPQDSTKPALATQDNQTAHGRSTAGYARQSGGVRSAMGSGGTSIADSIAEISRSLNESQQNLATVTAATEANMAESMAAANQAFQQAQQSVATAMEVAQQSVASATSASAPAGN